MPDEQKPETPVRDLETSYQALLNEGNWEADPLAGPTPRDFVTPAPEESPPEPRRIIEALLFVGGQALTPTRAGEIIRGLAPAQFDQAIAELNRAYRQQGRPYAIVAQGDGYVLTLRPRFRDVIEKLYGGAREARLSTVTLDVLSLVAYRQPITRLEIDSLRGADSGHLLRQLIRRGLVEVVHRAQAAVKEVSYGTTQRFLDLFGLQSLDDLPRTQDLQQI